MGDRFVAALTAVVLATAGYELADAAGWIHLGMLPGEDASGAGDAAIAGFAAMFAGGLWAAGVAIGGGPATLKWPWVVLPLAAATFLGARYYTYDAYYLPSRHRISDDSSAAWILFVCALGVIAAALAYRRGRVALPLLAVFLFLSAFTAVFLGSGH